MKRALTRGADRTPATPACSPLAAVVVGGIFTAGILSFLLLPILFAQIEAPPSSGQRDRVLQESQCPLARSMQRRVVLRRSERTLLATNAGNRLKSLEMRCTKRTSAKSRGAIRKTKSADPLYEPYAREQAKKGDNRPRNLHRLRSQFCERCGNGRITQKRT